MAELGLYSYAAVTLLFAFFCVLLITSWRGRLMGGLLILASCVSMIWSAALALQAADPVLPLVAIFTFEVLHSAAWLAFIAALAGTLGLPLVYRAIAHLIWSGTLIAGVYSQIGGGAADGDEALVRILIPGGLLMAFAGLVLIEQVYRNSPAEVRSAIKFLAIGVGGMFAYDLYLYSEAAMFGSIDRLSWDARGMVMALMIPLIAVSAQRNPQWDLNIFISRQVVFFSTALIAVGAYLLLMSLGAYFILLVGGTWSRVIQIVFLFGALLTLVFLLFSTSLRAKVKVFLVKHFFANKYDYREEWLRLVDTLSTAGPGNSGDTLILALAQMVGSPGGFLWSLNDENDRYALVARSGTGESVPDLANTDPIVEFMKKERWLVDLEEYRRKRSVYGELVFPDWLNDVPTAWLLVPLFAGRTLRGVMLLFEPEVPRYLNYEDRDLLKTAGQHLAVHLAQQDADRRLAESQQFDAYNRLTAYLMHDLKNLMAQQSLIVRNAEKHKHKPEFVDDTMSTIAGSVERMNKIMEQLARGRKLGTRRVMPVKYAVSNAIDRCNTELPLPELELRDPDVSISVDPERLSMVIQHLVRNAQQATPGDGAINVTVDSDKRDVIITVTDDGIGMTAEFVRERLFKPFDSTKGSQGMGIGAHQAREFAREMGGDIRVESIPENGTTFELRLPLA